MVILTFQDGSSHDEVVSYCGLYLRQNRKIIEIDLEIR